MNVGDLQKSGPTLSSIPDKIKKWKKKS